MNDYLKKPLILLGAGGHAKVLLSLVRAANLSILGVCAPELITQGITSWRGVNVLGSGDDLNDFDPDDISLVNGLGRRVGDNHCRKNLFENFKKKGYYFPVLIHPQSWVDPDAVLEEGAQIMAGVVIQADAHIGKNVIINTHVGIDHDCIIEDHVHIAPGAVLCGNVHIGKGAFIASGATLIQGITVGEEAVVGAGASIVRDLEPRQLVLPALVRRSQYCLEMQCGDKK